MQATILRIFLQILKNLIARIEMRILTLVFIVILINGCSNDSKENKITYVEEQVSEVNQSYSKVGKLRLSEYGFFTDPLAQLQPARNVFPYEMNTPLFTDYALKKRFIYLPDGANIIFDETEILQFPVGTILIKNFFYSSDQLGEKENTIIETRLLIHQEDGWQALPYIWNEEQTDAFLEITGGETTIELVKYGEFQYKVPNMAQCKSCHEYKGAIAPIGPTARQLNKEINGQNQLVKMSKDGILKGLPALSDVMRMANWEDSNSGSIDERARAYLDINCGHCHRPEGPGKNSGLDLTVFAQGEHALGIFKSPVAAGAGSGGHNFDIVPGKPQNSILIYRMESKDPGIMMPELGRSLVHQEGVALIRDWIQTLN